ncbi:hypothetical protein [Desulfobulbus propionicus]
MKKMYSGSLVIMFMGLLLQVCLFLVADAHTQEIVPDSQPARPVKLHNGWIDAVNEERVVIDDMASPLSTVTVYDQKGFRRDASSLAAGQYVAFKREGGATEIHLLDGKGERPKSSDRAANKQVDSQQKEAIRQVDGVWKN